MPVCTCPSYATPLCGGVGKYILRIFSFLTSFIITLSESNLDISSRLVLLEKRRKSQTCKWQNWCERHSSQKSGTDCPVHVYNVYTDRLMLLYICVCVCIMCIYIREISYWIIFQRYFQAKTKRSLIFRALTPV